MDRRQFIKLGSALGLSTLGPPLVHGRSNAKLPTRKLGRTGFDCTQLGLGGFAALHLADKDCALSIIETAFSLGINYYDTATKYGPSQSYLGEGLQGKRSDVWLTTKTLSRTREGALVELENSLKALRTDHVDLWLHHQVDTTEELSQILAPGGAAEAFAEAKAQKLTRFVGLSGHRDPAVFQAALAAFRPDVVLLPVNVADRHHLSFLDDAVTLAVKQQIGVVGMKVFAQGKMFSQLHLTPREALGYSLSQAVSTVIIGCDSADHVRENVLLAKSWKPMPKEEQLALEDKSRPLAKEMTWFKKW